jgi:acetyltransferase-like isoleucine patch superfamily enzyme
VRLVQATIPHVRRALYKASASYWRMRTLGHIRGSSFRIKRPEHVKVKGWLIVGRGTVIDSGARLVIEDGCSIGCDVYVGRDAVIVGFAPIDIGDRVLLGERVSLHTENHGEAEKRDEFDVGAISIGKDSWLAAGVVLTAGSSVGERCLIGANAVVKKAIPNDQFAAGVPARVIPRTPRVPCRQTTPTGDPKVSVQAHRL